MCCIIFLDTKASPVQVNAGLQLLLVSLFLLLWSLASVRLLEARAQAYLELFTKPVSVIWLTFLSKFERLCKFLMSNEKMLNLVSYISMKLQTAL